MSTIVGQTAKHVNESGGITVRNATVDDLPFLREMLYEAVHWDPRSDRPSMTDFFQNPEFMRLLDDWGRDGDVAIIASLGSIDAGAAWYRYWNEANHSYGYVDIDTPEIGMAVRQGYRSHGIGRLLLRALKRIAQARSVSRVSLSVDPKNYALALYTSEGFTKRGESGTSWTLACDLTR